MNALCEAAKAQLLANKNRDCAQHWHNKALEVPVGTTMFELLLGYAQEYEKIARKHEANAKEWCRIGGLEL